MDAYVDKSQEKTGKTVSAASNKQTVSRKSISPYLQDNRPQSVIQKKQAEALGLKSSPHSVLQPKANKTGLPDQLKAGIENLSGHAMDDVNVHYNSDKPAQLQAHAYAQGTDIHIAPGQQQHLPHEAWHVVQQKQGRVKPTLQLKKDIAVNDDKGLESEADTLGKKALTFQLQQSQHHTTTHGLAKTIQKKNSKSSTGTLPVQRTVVNGASEPLSLETITSTLEGDGITVTPRGSAFIKSLIEEATPNTVQQVKDKLAIDYKLVGDAVEALSDKLKTLHTTIHGKIAVPEDNLVAILREYNNAIRPILSTFLATILDTDKRLKDSSFAVLANASFARGELALHSDLDVGFVINSDNVDEMMEVRTVLVEIGKLVEEAKASAGITGEALSFDANMNVRPTLTTLVEANLKMQNVIQDVAVIHEKGGAGLGGALKTETTRQNAEHKELLRSGLADRIFEFKLPAADDVTNRGQVINIKSPYIRFLTLITRDLASLAGIGNTSTVDRLGALARGGVIPTDLAKRLIIAINFLLAFRMKLHAHYGSEKDTAIFKSNWIEKNPEGYIMNDIERTLFKDMLTSLHEYNGVVLEVSKKK